MKGMGISPNKGESKDKSLENPSIGEPSIYDTDAQNDKKGEAIGNETLTQENNTRDHQDTI